MAWRVLLVSILIQSVAILAGGGRDYNARESVPVLVNNVGPFNNPAETYPYYTLPFCAPKDTKDEDEKIGETLAGDRRQYSLYDMRFKVDVDWRSLCHFRLSQDEIRAFSDAIRENYVFEMFIDDLPVKGFVGEIEHTSMKFDTHMHNQSHIYLFTHLDFSIAFNGPNIIAVNLTTDAAQRVELQYDKDIDVEFSYAMQWIPTNVPWVDRMSLHQKSAIGDQAVEIHWLSIINSFVLVVLLTAFLAIILFRVLKRDFARYMDVDETELPSEDDGQEIGWKQVHGDVFRAPPNLMLFSAMVGTGAQVLVLVVSILLLALVGTFYPGNRGAVYSAAICLYAATAVIAGYVSTTLYVSLGGQKWATNAVLTACLFALPFFSIFIVINSVAMAYGSSSALRFTIVLLVFFSWAAVSLPMTIVGSMKAKKAAPFDAPCKTNRAEREIPPVAWYRSLPIQMFIAGFLPFSAIYIELHYIFASVWGHRVYTLFGILSLAFIMLIIVTAFITIALTYFLLAAEDYRWWWRSFLSGSSTGVFMYAYAVFYYVYRSEMNGTLQATFFFGYMLVISYAFSLMLGSVGFYMARKFVKHIYSSIKID